MSSKHPPIRYVNDRRVVKSDGRVDLPDLFFFPFLFFSSPFFLLGLIFLSLSYSFRLSTFFVVASTNTAAFEDSGLTIAFGRLTGTHPVPTSTTASSTSTVASSVSG